ncbi:unnamed protein product [Brassicogethes aeneus]|uniref:BAH domain-containing protein n=1 Tax=Brassicogethes aeneus TaxID=1431903 RepID=A0A9P0BMV1_BRAAE|nr:unnamed protein product [Brassicogethes aeneus]
MLGSPAGPGGPTQRGLWPLAPAPSAATFPTDGIGKYGVYSLFPGTHTFGNALYSHASTIGRFASGHIQQSSGNSFHTAHKVSDSLFSTTGYTFGAPTPPPGSPYSPIPVAQLELLTKGFNSNIIQIQPDYPSSPKKVQIQEKRCDEKCCNVKQKSSCNCPASPVRSLTGCSRTNPIEWNGVNVKKEPGTPCQVAEISTSASPMVKLEVTSPTQKNTETTSIINSSLITTNEAANASMATAMGGTILQCADDRSSSLAGWQLGGAHGNALATPTLWQYPAPIPMEPMVPVPTMPTHSGFQLIRDPNTGGLLLIPTTSGIESLQQAVVWPSYPQPPSVLLPSLQSLPPPPLQLLSSASDYLSSSTTLHQHTQTHSTRLVAVTTDAKRKIPIPATTLIKIETDHLDQTKTLQAVSTIASNTGTVYTDPNMMTTHLIYQHPTNLILSQTPTAETACRSQATSPVACLTPPPENVHMQEEECLVQDASNQTDTPICSEDDNTTHMVSDVIGEPKEVLEDEEQFKSVVEEVVEEPIARVPTPVAVEEPTPDLSGLELLSNSIVEFERQAEEEPKAIEVIPEVQQTIESPPVEVATKKEESLGGLDLLCALAEQRIMEESTENPKEEPVRTKEKKERRREKRKSKKHSSDEPRRKKLKKHRKHSSDSEKVRKCSCQRDEYHSYKNLESEQEVKKFIESKTHGHCCKGDWPCMNPMELDMRMKLADLQRQYRENVKQLNKLKPKKHHECSKKKRKKSTHERSLTPPPQLDKIEAVKPKNVSELLKPPTLCPFEKLPEIETDVESSSSSKKRKVGRPKKLSSEEFNSTTETIVAKKPKSNNIVGYLLAAKEKLQLQKNMYCDSPPRYIEESPKSKIRNINNNIEEKSKIRPKLRAETTLKAYIDEENYDAESEDDEIVDHIEIDLDEAKEVEAVEMEDQKLDDEEEVCEEVKPEDSRCTLTSELLEVDKLRVLTAMGGLFYAGCLNALEPPDIYSITLDGERGNRPHIMSREEILRDAIVEVSPKSTDDLPVGTRLCAYWSQQYRCLYPGSVAEPGTPDPHLDGKFVSVEFDDGDSGRIALEDIRFLPPDYPIIEYDPNPLLSLSKRKRRASTSVSVEERRSSSSTNPESPSDCKSADLDKENKTSNKQTELEKNTEYKEAKKRLKKKKRDKLKQKLMHDDKKKRKKHKCVEEHCKHKRHHKKHKKHKKHHDKEREDVKTVEVDSKRLDTIEEDDVEEEDTFEEEETTIDAPEYHVVANPDDEVTMDDILESEDVKKSKKIRNRQESCESRSKISAFLPANQLWGWSGKGYKRTKAKGRSKKCFYRSIQRGKETITIGDCAVFLSTGRPDRPYIGRIEAMWEMYGTMIVKVKWFYHPEETVGCPLNLQYPGALFESPHSDENDVQTISHRCEVVPLKEYRDRLGNDPQRYATIYDNNDIYYLAGYYDPGTKNLKMEPGIPFSKEETD